jgi:N6-adenosine-specific RNA methylase IME4
MREAIPRAQVILADPPWRYDFSKHSRNRIENHYRTMPLEAICSLPVGELAAEDCMLFLWGTSPKLPDAIRVLEAWGFDYVSSAVWRKSGLGMGYYFRQDHEILLLGRRGSPGIPDPSQRVSSVVEARKGLHSAKPWQVYEIIERMYPEAVKLELFCRTPQPGWYSWGNEAFPTLFSGPILPGEALAARVEE